MLKFTDSTACTICVLFIILGWVSFAIGDTYEPNTSKIRWTVKTVTSGNNVTTSKTYEGEELNRLTRAGIKNPAMDLSCSFEFEKSLTPRGDGVSPFYSEKITQTCQLGEVEILVEPVTCTTLADGSSRELSVDRGGISLNSKSTVDQSATTLTFITCSTA